MQDSFFGVSHDRLPVGTIPLLAVSSAPAYADALGRFARSANDAHAEFLASEDGRGFCGQVRKLTHFFKSDFFCGARGKETYFISTKPFLSAVSCKGQDPIKRHPACKAHQCLLKIGKI